MTNASYHKNFGELKTHENRTKENGLTMRTAMI